MKNDEEEGVPDEAAGGPRWIQVDPETLILLIKTILLTLKESFL